MDAANSIPLRSLAEAVSCVCLTEEVEVQNAVVEFFAGLGLGLMLHSPRSLAEVHALARKSHAFSLAYLRSAAQIGGALSTVAPVRSVQSPPLLAVCAWKPTPAEREALRLSGVAHVLEWPLVEDRSGRTARVFADANTSFKVSQDFMVATDVLQTMGARRRSGLVTVSCPHHADFGTDDWQSGGACDGSDEGSCSGWYGRLYLAEGALIHAETPTQKGVDALAQMIELSRSTMRMQSVFIEPAQPNLSGTLENNILNAALIIDNKKNGRAPATGKPALKAIPSTRVSRPPPVPPARQPKRSDDMKLEGLVGAAPELRAAVRADGAGEVLESFGSVDADSLSAVAGMCAAPLERIAELLGLRGLSSWSFSAADMNVYVYREEKGFIAVTGGASKNNEATFKKLAALTKGRP